MRSPLFRAAAICFLGVSLVWALQESLAERFWLATALAHTPAVVFAVPPILVCVVALFSRTRIPFALSMLALLIVGFGMSRPALRLSARPAAPENTIRVMQYNIQFERGGAKRLLETISRHDPDILCLQEAGTAGSMAGPSDDLLKALRRTYHLHRSGELLIASRFPVVRAEAVVMSASPASRPLLLAEVVANGKSLTILNAHLIPLRLSAGWQRRSAIYPRNLTQAGQDRSSQIRQIARAVHRTKGPIVLCGDLNMSPIGPAYRDLSAVLQDAWRESGSGWGNTLTSTIPVRRVDYIWLRGLRSLKPSVGLSRASDHRPVIADVALTARAG